MKEYMQMKVTTQSENQQQQQQPMGPNLSLRFNYLEEETGYTIALCAIFIREFLATYCLFLLGSRLGTDLFIARPFVFAYIGVMFRRPLVNPMITLFACLCSDHWGKASVSGFPVYLVGKTSKLWLIPYCVVVMGIQMSAAVAAAYTEDFNSHKFGDEFIKNAAWGTGQLHLRINENRGTCWGNTGPGTQFTDEIPIHSPDIQNNTACALHIKSVWILEDAASMLFLTASYVHVWKWLRYDDVTKLNPADDEERYWMKIAAFSAATGVFSLMNSLAFPTADSGWHVSIYKYVYQNIRTDLHITNNQLGEPGFRIVGSLIGCTMTAGYEYIIYSIDYKEKEKDEEPQNTGPVVPAKKPDMDKGGISQEDYNKGKLIEAIHVFVYMFSQRWHEVEVTERLKQKQKIKDQKKQQRINNINLNPDIIKNPETGEEIPNELMSSFHASTRPLFAVSSSDLRSAYSDWQSHNPRPPSSASGARPRPAEVRLRIPL